MQVSKRLVVHKEIPVDTAKEMDLLTSMDVAMAEQYCKVKNFNEGLKKFKEVIPIINDEREKRAVINKYLNFSLSHGQNLMGQQKFLEALEVYREIMQVSYTPINVYKQIGLCMKNLGLRIKRRNTLT